MENPYGRALRNTFPAAVLKDRGMGPHPVQCMTAQKALLELGMAHKIETDFQNAIEDLQKTAQGSPDGLGHATPGGQGLLAANTHDQPKERSWEHWFPRMAPMSGPVKQLALDRATKKKWAGKIISLLAPYHEHFSNMQPVSVGEDKYEKWRPLVGKTRTNSLKSFFYGLRKLRSFLEVSPLPLTEEGTK